MLEMLKQSDVVGSNGMSHRKRSYPMVIRPEYLARLEAVGVKLEKFRHKPAEWQALAKQTDWEGAQQGLAQERLARVVVLGLPGSGKSSLLNRWVGWTVSTPVEGGPCNESIEDFGLFCLVDVADKPQPNRLVEILPVNGQENGGQEGGGPWGEFHPALMPPLQWSEHDPLLLAEEADLLVYVVDGTAGAQAADYRWVGRLRRLGKPMLVLLSKTDRLGEQLVERRAETEARLGTMVWPVSVEDTPTAVEAQLVKMSRLCPKLTVALGREVSHFRTTAARRLIRQAAWINGAMALQPVPLVDVPLQLSVLLGLLVRIAAIYERPRAQTHRREVVTAVAGGLVSRYGVQQLVKLVPVVGWLVSGLIGWSCTWLLGRAAITYYSGSGQQAMARTVSQAAGSVRERWQRRPQVRVAWGQAEAAEQVEPVAAVEG